MAVLTWDNVGEKVFETGIDHGVLYVQDNDGTYPEGVAWNGLTTVTESPSGAESNPQYADNIKYVNLISAEEFGATVEAFTYPDEFAQCDGTAIMGGGVGVGQQGRKSFGLAYRSLVGNDIEGTEYGYKLHLIYGATAAPSEKAFATVNDSPEAITFSWELTTTPAPVGTVNSVQYKPTASIIIDSTKVDAAALADLEDILFGTVGDDPSLPTPAFVLGLFVGSTTEVALHVQANQPTFVTGTGVVTLPSVTGIQWKQDGVNKAPGAQTAVASGVTTHITAHPQDGYVLSDNSDDHWTFTRT